MAVWRVFQARTLVLVTAAATAAIAPAGAARAATAPVPFSAIVPAPASVAPAAGVTFNLTSTATIYTEPGSTAAAGVGGYLAALLRRSTGYPLPVADAPGANPADGIALLLSG